MIIRRRIIIGLCLVSLVAVIASVPILLQRNQQESRLLHRDFWGVILSYEETENGIVITLDNDSTESHRHFLWNADTRYIDPETEARLQRRLTGWHAVLTSEYLTSDVSDPAEYIYPLFSAMIDDRWLYDEALQTDRPISMNSSEVPEAG